MAKKKDKHVENAIKHVSKGNYSKAIAEYQKVIALDPKDHKAYQKLGECYLKTKNTPDAIKHFMKASSLYYRDGFYHKAQALYKQILTIDKDNVSVRMDLADVCQKLGYMNEALIQYNHVAEVHERSNKGAEALEIFQKMVQLDPSNTNSRMKLAELYFRQGQRPQGYEEFEKVSEELRSSGRHEELARMLEKLIKQDPDRQDNYKMIADVYSEIGQYEQAQKALEQVLKKKPKDMGILEKLVDIHIRQRDIGKISETLKRLAEIARAEGDENKAQEYMKRILRFDPSNEEALATVGMKAEAEAPAAVPEEAHTGPIEPEEEILDNGPPVIAADDGEDDDVQVLEDDAVIFEDEDDEDEIEALAPGEDEEIIEPAAPIEEEETEIPPPPLQQADETTFLSQGNDVPDSSAGDGGDVAKMITEADVYIKYGLMERATQLVDEALAIHHNHPQAIIKKAQIIRETGDATQAENLILNAATEEHEEGNLASAKALYEEVIRVNPGNSFASDALADLDVSEDIDIDDGATEPAAPVQSNDIFADDGDHLVLADEDIGLEGGYETPASKRTFSASDEETLELAPDDDMDSPPVMQETVDPEPPAAVGDQVLVDEEDAFAIEGDEPPPVQEEEVLQEPEAGFGIEGEEAEESDEGIETDQFEPESVDDFADEQPEEEAPEPPEFEAEAEAETEPEQAEEDIIDEQPEEEAPEPPELEAEAEAEPEQVEEDEDEGEEYTAEFTKVREHIEAGEKLEAKQILRRILILDPDCDAADELMDQVDAMPDAPPKEERAPEPEVEEEPAPEEEAIPEEASGPEAEAETPTDEISEDAPPTTEDGIFDLAAELEDEGLFAGLGGEEEEPAQSGMSYEEEMISSQISAFTKGASKQLAGDSEGHFQLGIAYKEMDLIDEAVDAFNKALEAGGNPAQCLNMIAICYMTRGRFVQAEEALLKALSYPELSELEIMNLKFDFGALKDSLGQKEEALISFLEVAEISEDFRDGAVKTYIERLRMELGKPPESEPPPGPKGSSKGPPGSDPTASSEHVLESPEADSPSPDTPEHASEEKRKKKSKVSYI